MHTLLWVLLGLDGLQLLVAVAALVRGRRSLRAGASSHARYSFLHAALLAGGSVVLAVPLLLGLGDAISDELAVSLAFALELVVFPLARAVLGRLEAAHYGRRPA